MTDVRIQPLRPALVAMIDFQKENLLANGAEVREIDTPRLLTFVRIAKELTNSLNRW
jgi:hypothetical protein